jgi:hypothetical protein
MIGFLFDDGIRVFEFPHQFGSNDGSLMLFLIALNCFVCCLLSRLTWKIWREAMNAKDQEIARLAQERNKYQSVVFDRLLGSDDLVVLTHKGWPEDEGGGGSPSQEKVH